MSATVCLAASTYGYPEGGGHFWVYLNWALGLRSVGCRVLWLEVVRRDSPQEAIASNAAALRKHLDRFGLADGLILSYVDGESLPAGIADCLNLEAAPDADLLLNLRYSLRPEIVRRFRRAALIDIDPGLLQGWLHARQISVAPHDIYFTIGETVGTPGSPIPTAGLEWRYTPPCVSLDWWPSARAADDAPFTTVSHWYMDEWERDADGIYPNDKRTGFLPFLDLPGLTTQPLELALCLRGDTRERQMLEEKGWRVRESSEVTASPQDYQRYVQSSRGEFSCVKPSCIRLQNAWISDRTICYLASGKPAVVQHTGPSRFLPDAAGLFRFRDVHEAARHLETAAADYERQSRVARALAEECFDARKVVRSVLERALP